MKVILLAPTPPPTGGIASWTVRMLKANLKNGWKVDLVDEKLIGDRQVFGSKSKRNILTEIKRTLGIWKKLIFKLNDKDVKVVHSCIPASTPGMIREFVCALLTKIYRKKFIIHYRCTIPNMVRSKRSLLVFRMLTNISDLVITLNTPSSEFVKKNSSTKIELIPNFIEKSSVINEDEKKISKKVQQVLYVGGVIGAKGCYDIIKVAERFPEIQFRLVGRAEKEIIDMSKPPNVLLLGEKNKSEVKLELANADLFMFVSYFRGEGFSNSLVEAMAQGLPSIVSDWAANRDMIENKGGIVVPVKDVNAMGNALNELLENSKLRKTQSNWNIRKVRKNYLDETITELYVDAYEKVLKKH